MSIVNFAGARNRLYRTGAPASTVAPVISGTTTTGQTLTSTAGTWTNAPTFACQRLRNGSNIGGATSSTYRLQVADEGMTITCRVTAAANSQSTSANSNPLYPTSSGASLSAPRTSPRSARV